MWQCIITTVTFIFIFIGIQHYRFHVLPLSTVQSHSHIIQGIRRDKVIVVQQSDIGSPRHLNSCIGVARDASVLPQMPVSDTAILCLFRQFLHGSFHRIAGTGIDQNQFPSSIALSADRVYHLPQEFRGRLISRHNNAEQPGQLRRLPALCFQQIC